MSNFHSNNAIPVDGLEIHSSVNLSKSKRILISLKPKQVESIECLIDENFPTTASIINAIIGCYCDSSNPIGWGDQQT